MKVEKFYAQQHGDARGQLVALEENKEIVAELCREMGKELKAIDDPWYKERILSDMIPY